VWPPAGGAGALLRDGAKVLLNFLSIPFRGTLHFLLGRKCTPRRQSRLAAYILRSNSAFFAANSSADTMPFCWSAAKRSRVAKISVL
jgi:hypothetical protein